MKLYRFSPISDYDQLQTAVRYVITEATKLYVHVVGDANCTITYVTLFAHYDQEYDDLVALVTELGEAKSANNGIEVILREPLVAMAGVITVHSKSIEVIQHVLQIRIRRPDPYRMQVGCADYDGINFNDFYDYHAGAGTDNRCRLIERADLRMIELSDPDVDVLAYVTEPVRI